MTAPDLSRLNILVADDSRMMRELLVAMLNAVGVQNVRAVRDGGEALNALKLSRYDLVITDVDMGGMDGLDLVRILRRTGKTPDPYIPIIMITDDASANGSKPRATRVSTNSSPSPCPARSFIAACAKSSSIRGPSCAPATLSGPTAADAFCRNTTERSGAKAIPIRPAMTKTRSSSRSGNERR